MNSLNRATLIGNLGKNPEIRTTQSGKTVASFPLATSEQWQDANGQRREKTTWHNVVVWGGQAEPVAKYLSKGSPVYVEGRIQSRRYEDKDGNERFITEINASNVIFLGKGSGNAGASGDNEPPFPADDDMQF